MSIPNGIAPHYLWTMDGRMWIENSYASAGSLVAKKSLDRALTRGWAHPIPEATLRTLVAQTLEASAAIPRLLEDE